jgi:hypothetical protein
MTAVTTELLRIGPEATHSSWRRCRIIPAPLPACPSALTISWTPPSATAARQLCVAQLLLRTALASIFRQTLLGLAASFPVPKREAPYLGQLRTALSFNSKHQQRSSNQHQLQLQLQLPSPQVTPSLSRHFLLPACAFPFARDSSSKPDSVPCSPISYDRLPLSRLPTSLCLFRSVDVSNATLANKGPHCVPLSLPPASPVSC